jgi:hypothetical protein
MDGNPHHWHQPAEQASRIHRKGIPVRICCFCGAIIAEAFDVKEGCGPYVMDTVNNEIAK